MEAPPPGGGNEWPPPRDRAKRRRQTESSESSSDEAPNAVSVDAAYSPPSPQYSPASPLDGATATEGDFSADVLMAVRRFERAARLEFRALLQQGCSVQVAVDRLLGKLSSGVSTKPSAAAVDALAAESGLTPEVASWALMLRDELSRLRRCGTPPPDSVDVLTARLQESNLDVEPPLSQSAVPAAASVAPSMHVPAAAEAARKRAPDAAVSSVEDETQKRRRDEKDRMGAVLDAVAAAVRANTVAPPSPPPHLISALLRRSNSELEDEDDAGRKRRSALTASEEARIQKKTRSTRTGIPVQNEG